ncbi:MAG TPA: hypothetical protein P5550_07840 [Bacteroidales bacterium]|nr:hypothetical protein [Bacteroidales bacterium]HRZ77216.1 hypothetical protein [Bacteroidales bacterium]
MPQVLIGIDDTDHAESRGTGYLSRQLAELIEDQGLGSVESISRHYLLQDHPEAGRENSAVCLEVETRAVEELWSFCSTYVRDESRPEASPGLVMCPKGKGGVSLVSFGKRAKTAEVDLEEALELGAAAGIRVAGWNQGRGRIGALAALGLRQSGEDGRFIWLPRLRELQGIYTAEDLLALTRTDRIVDDRGRPVDPQDNIEVGTWVSPVIREHQITLIVRRDPHRPDCWLATDREYVMREMR